MPTIDKPAGSRANATVRLSSTVKHCEAVSKRCQLSSSGARQGPYRGRIQKRKQDGARGCIFFSVSDQKSAFSFSCEGRASTTNTD